MDASQSDPSIEFAQIVSSEDASIDLARAALTFARHEYGGLDIDEYVHRLDRLAGKARSAAGAHPTEDHLIRGLHLVLFEREKFHGNNECYYDPRNSFLNEVLDPITLSCVYIEVARRLGLEMKGIGLPGHFIVQHRQNGFSLFRDPFNGGRILTKRECQRRVREILGEKVPFRSCFLEPCTNKQILARMLGNLKGISLRDGDFNRALWVVDDLLAIDPCCVEQIRDRGMIHLHLQHPAKALADLEWYLTFAPQAADAHDICEIVRKLRSLNAGLN
jgi:regulator of sirC expression with transglutaminase-like and TPR domain